MERLVFASFADAHTARDAQRAVTTGGAAESHRRRSLLHEGEFHPLLARDLSGTPAQVALERSTVARNAAWFFGVLAIGLAIDLSGWFPELPWVATMVFGSIGVVAGALAVLMADPGPLERPLERAQGDLRVGRVLLTLRVDQQARAQAAEDIAAHGGEHLFDA